VKCPLTHKVSAHSIAPIQDLTIRALAAAIGTGDAFEKVHFK
jgi:hypothetical protein